MPTPTSRTGKLELYDLVEDVLLLILAECDILDVLAIGAASKYLHRLAGSHDVWVLLVTNLAQRGFIDRQPDDFKDLNTEQLIGLVKRMLRGPQTWVANPAKSLVKRSASTLSKLVRKPSAKPPAREPRRIVLHPEIAAGPEMPFEGNIARLLPGGEFVLFLNSARLECWNVFEDRLLWKHLPSMDHTTLREFGAELVGHQLVVSTCQRNWGGHVPGHTFLEVCTLDTKSGLSTLELVTRVPDADNPYYGCSVCGDIVAVYLYAEYQVVLVNWRTHSQIVLEANTSEPIGFKSQFAFVPDFLVSAQRDSIGNQRLAVIPFASLGSWEPTTILEEPAVRVNAVDISLRTAGSIPVKGHLSLSWQRSLYVHQNPLRRGLYKVYLHTVADRADILCSYDLVRHNGEMSWRLVSSTRMWGGISQSGLSLSGHAIGWRSGQSRQIVFAPTQRDSGLRDLLKIDGRSNIVHLSPYSGALTYSTSQEIVIVYCV
ncbi:hypothetical protein C8R47DRAFT_1320919 [Mycena vitilis]|nr:hypothetical protein C8R47DRAFT_1320919 [Mycena vitilis]